jgi:O-antigen/teichoic acid export membrane protein
MTSAAAPLPRAGAADEKEPRTGRLPRRGGQVYFAATLVAQAAALIRYVTLARILGPEQLGLAATLILTSAFFDMVSDAGADKFLVQDRHGDDPEVQKLTQLIFIGRGAVIAACLVVLAGPLAQFYKAPQIAPAFAALALAPLIAGFTHLDNRRTQRNQDFRSEAVTIACAEMAGLAATVAAAIVTRSYTAVLYGLIVRALVTVLVSHLRAERRYVVGYVRDHAARLAVFGGPLMLNGVMLFVGSQGDRVIVANQLGVAALGHYSAILLLIYYPAATLMRYVAAMQMPIIAAHRDDPTGRDHAIDALGGQTLLLAVVMAVGFAVAAPMMAPFLYGVRFSQPALTVGLIGVLQTARYLIVWPTTGALAMGFSRSVLAANVARLAVFPAALAGLWLQRSLVGVIGGFVAGELFSVAVGLVLLNWNNQRALLGGFDRLGLFLAVAAAVVSANLALLSGSMAAIAGAAVFTLVICACVGWRERRTLLEAFSLAGRLLAARRRVGA